MKTTIIIGERFSFTTKTAETRKIFYAESEAEGYLYHIEHPEVDSYIVNSGNFTSGELKALIEHIHYLNSIISIIIIHDGSLKDNDFQKMENIFLCPDKTEIDNFLSSLPENHRADNRTEWPIRVIFWDKQNDREKLEGNILSISSGGCFVRTGKKLAQGTPILMTIIFKDFNLFSEGEIVRLSSSGTYQPEGLAVKFLRITPQTRKCIQNIINERILGDLMKKLDPEKSKGIE